MEATIFFIFIFAITIFAITTLFLIKKGIIKNNLVFGMFVGLIMGAITIFISPVYGFFTSTECISISTEMAGYLVVISIIAFLTIVRGVWLKKAYVLLAKGMILGYIFIFMITTLLVFITPHNMGY